MGASGMIGGILVVAAAPSLLTEDALPHLRAAVENTCILSTHVASEGMTGVATGTVVGVVAASETGVAALSALDSTHGVAELGGAAGGASMAAVIFASVSSFPVVIVVC